MTETTTLIQDLDSVAAEIFEMWDKGMKSGKLLTHLEGRLERYDPRISRIREALSKLDREVAPPLVPVDTAACMAFLQTFDSEWLRATELATGLTRGAWRRTRKYTDPKTKDICRDFANKGVPVVVTLGQDMTGVTVVRERGMGMWEREFAAFENWHDNGPKANLWEERMLWPSLRAEDFAFGVSTEEMEGHAFFFQPKSLPKDEGWDQHSPIDHLFRAIGLDGGGEVCESTYMFTRDGQDGFDATALLVEAGFTHDKKLDGICGS